MNKLLSENQPHIDSKKLTPANDQLRDVQRQLTAITNAVEAAIAHVDCNQRIKLVNEHFATTFGTLAEPQRLDGQRLEDAIGAENYSLVQLHLLTALAGQKVKFELRLSDSVKPQRCLEVTCVPCFDDAHAVNGCVIIATAIATEAVGQKTELAAVAPHESNSREVIDHVLGFVGMLDLDGTLRHANAPWLQAAGVSRAEVVGKKFWDCPWWNFDPERIAQLKQWVRRAADGEPIRADTQIQLAGGQRCTIDFMLAPVKDPSGRVTHLIPSGIDISKRKTAQKNLALSNQHRSLAMSAAGMGAFEWDFETDEILWDEQHRKITGLTVASEQVGQSFLDLIHPDDIDQYREELNAAMLSRGDFESEFRIVSADGEIRWLAARAKIVSGPNERSRLVGLNWDITQQKLTLIKFKLGEERLRLAAEAAGFGTYQADLRKNEAIWSEDLMGQVGVNVKDGYGHGSLEVPSFIHPDDREMVAAELAKAIEQNGPRIHTFSHRIVQANGQIRWLKMQGKTSFSKKGTPEQIIGTLLDITQQKKIEQSLEEARRVAELASQSKSEFLANMSHEIRTPMSAIMGYTELLTRQLTDPDDLKCASIIRHNGKFLLEIINDILDISKIEAGKLEISKKRFRPQQVLCDVHALMKVRAAEKGIELEVAVEGEIPKTIRSDAKRLKQILVNLIGNAIKFTDSGTVRAVVSYVDQTKPKLRFDVIDTGIGMTLQQQEHLFQPFTQADSSLVREYGGTGLGLSISQRLARMLGGEINVASQSKVGSTFSLTIDTGSLKNISFTKSELTVHPPVAASRLDRLPKIEGRILVVDDRREIRFIAQQFIEDAGGVVTAAENGRAAIQCVKQALKRKQPFDLIAMDMQMPVMDGYQATSQLRLDGFENPIIAITAHAMEGDREKCLAAGCTDYMAKPLDGPKFIKLIAEHLDAQQEVQPDACRVLVIEDSKDAGRAMKQLLEFEGHVVDVATDGKSGIELAEKWTPAVILLDLGLPDISGLEVAKKLRKLKSLSNSLIVAATGRNDFQETAQAGFDCHLVKPIDFDKLSSVVKNHLKQKSLVRCVGTNI